MLYISDTTFENNSIKIMSSKSVKKIIKEFQKRHETRVIFSIKTPLFELQEKSFIIHGLKEVCVELYNIMQSRS